jgi:hypothetical protein
MCEEANRTIPEPYVRQEFVGNLLWNCLSVITCLALLSSPSEADAGSCYQSTVRQAKLGASSG